MWILVQKNLNICEMTVYMTQMEHKYHRGDSVNCLLVELQKYINSPHSY